MFEFEMIERGQKNAVGTEDVNLLVSGISIGKNGLEKLGIPTTNESFLLNILIDEKRRAVAFQVPVTDAERKAAYKFAKHTTYRWCKTYATAHPAIVKLKKFAGVSGELKRVEGTRFWVIQAPEPEVKTTNEREGFLSEALS